MAATDWSHRFQPRPARMPDLTPPSMFRARSVDLRRCNFSGVRLRSTAAHAAEGGTVQQQQSFERAEQVNLRATWSWNTDHMATNWRPGSSCQ